LTQRARGLLLLAFVALLLVGCGGSSRRECSVVFRAVPTNGRPVTAAGMQIAQQVVENRIDKIGVTSPSVAVHGDELVVEFGGTHALPDVAKTIAIAGRFEIFDFEPNLEPPSVGASQQPTPRPSLYRLLEPVQGRANAGSPQAYYLFTTKSAHSVLQGPAPTVKQLFSPYKGGKQPDRTVVLKVPANSEPVRCAVTALCPGAGLKGLSKTGTYWYLLHDAPALTGKDLVKSGISANVDQNSGQPIVTLQFTKHGSNEFRRITRAEYDRGRVNAGGAGALNTRNQTEVNRFAGHNAIVLDGRLIETPYIDYTDPALSQGIVGNAQITEPSTAVAKRTALVLQSGSLPYILERVKLSGCVR
jgi:preprotein translocase subunit SecD